MQRHKFKVQPQQSGARVDLYLVQAGLELSRRKIREVIDAGGVFINGKRVRVASRTVQSGDEVRMEFHLETLKKIKRQEFKLSASDILYEDEGLLAINKPPGLASQATRDQSVMHAAACLEKFLKERDGRSPKLILVHRLDKETSGVLLIAKNANVATFLTDAFREKTIKKTYWALVRGVPPNKKFREQCFLSPIQEKTGTVRKVLSGGKSSLTDFELLKSNKQHDVSLIACYPHTGRSHQIRVHLLLQQLPILGDKKYGAPKSGELNPEIAALASEHHLLHAHSLSFVPAPRQAAVSIEAPLPQQFRKLCELLGFTVDHFR